MKKLLLFLITALFCSSAIASDFIHPLDFRGTEREKKEVIAYIKQHVKETYSAVGMDDPMTLRMMEKDELKCFKELTKIKDRKLLDAVIKQYSAVGMDAYNTILMMYNEQKKASGESLEW
ncbi:MAG: hypothetical protein ACSHYA_02570 [Opitutaceae bacterium]